jgi:hypothetical protein
MQIEHTYETSVMVYPLTTRNRRFWLMTSVASRGGRLRRFACVDTLPAPSAGRATAGAFRYTEVAAVLTSDAILS